VVRSRIGRSRSRRRIIEASIPSVCRRRPRGHRGGRYRHRQVTPSAQRCIIGTPVLHTVTSLWNFSAALFIDFVGHAALGFRRMTLYLTIRRANPRPISVPTSSIPVSPRFSRSGRRFASRHRLQGLA
jgi:hypothetical protein